MTRRTLVVCPGRGSYTADELGTLVERSELSGSGSAAKAVLDEADHFRRDVGSPSMSELDRQPRFTAGKHLVGPNNGPLIYTGSAIDFSLLSRERFRPVAVLGNSMGWYTALHVGGVFGFGDGMRLVDTMSKSQKGKPVGGQLIIPIVDDDWQLDEARRAAVEDLLAELSEEVGPCQVSIELGGFLVLAGDDQAVAALKERLPVCRLGKRDYPFQLAQHAAFHTPLMGEPSRLGQELLADLPWRPPSLSLVDGKGRILRPRIATGREIFEYTLGEQVLDTFDFTAALRVALREFAPDVIVLLGPGDSLGGAIGQTLVREGWAGIRSKAEFIARQRSDEPVLISMGRREQFERFVIG